MALQTLRINRTPVNANPKCEGCVHYDGNAQAKGGACEVGTSPALCGSGAMPKYGYAPLAELGPDEIDDLATPALGGSVGAMNEYGRMEQPVQMKQVVLGDDDLNIAQRIFGEMTHSDTFKSGMFKSQGQIGIHVPNATAYVESTGVSMYDVARELHTQYFAPRKQKKFSLGDTLQFLKSHGMHVTDDDLFKAGSVPVKGQSQLPTSGNHPSGIPWSKVHSTIGSRVKSYQKQGHKVLGASVSHSGSSTKLHVKYDVGGNGVMTGHATHTIGPTPKKAG